MTTSLRFARRILCSTLLMAQAACLGPPRPVETPAPYLRAETPKRIWVKLASGDEMVIDAPQVFGDTLLGYTQTPAGRGESVWLPLSDLQEVQARHVSTPRTVGFGALIAASLGLAIAFFPSGGGGKVVACEDREDCGF